MEDNIRERLFQQQDLKYRDFTAKLIPNIDKETIIGVRTPAIKQLARQLAANEAARFMQTLPHKYYEENNLHGQLIANMKDFEAVIAELDRFLPFVDNWATCDLISPKIFRKNMAALLPHIDKWLADDRVYTIRFGIEMLMSFYLDEEFKTDYLAKVVGIRSEEYYINMMVAWYFATALAKQYEAVIPYLEQHRLGEWTHKKAIQKAIESRRISDDKKAYLRTLRK